LTTKESIVSSSIFSGPPGTVIPIIIYRENHFLMTQNHSNPIQTKSQV